MPTSTTLSIPTRGQGLYDITDQVSAFLAQTKVQDGLCCVFVKHTSASLVISENYDPSAKTDLQTFMVKLVPEGQAWMRHVDEGPDDSPSHMRAMLTRTSEVIPIVNGKLTLGTWQGIYLFEHRRSAYTRQVVLQLMG